MKFKRILIRTIALMLVLITVFQLMACNMSGILDSNQNVEENNDWWNDAGNWWDDKTEEVDSWWDDKSEEVGDWWDDKSEIAGDWLDKKGEEFDKWWDETSPSIEIWWGETSENMDAWWDETVEKGGDLYDAATVKFHEISDQISAKSDEILDKVVTYIAQSMYENSQREFVGKLTASYEQLSEVEALSSNSEDYDYDTAAFVYKLVRAMFPEEYEVFPALLYNHEDECVIGLAYTNFEKVYQSDSGKFYYASGFIALDGEIPLTVEDLELGTEIYRADGVSDDNASFFLAYLPDSYTTHCVIFDQYLIFGIDENGQIFYHIEDYDDSCQVNSSYGELYSFDENSISNTYDGKSYLTDSPFMARVMYASRSVEAIKEDIYEQIGDVKADFSNLDVKKIFNTAKENVSKIFDENGIVSSIKNMTINDLIGVDIFSKKETDTATNREKMILGTAVVIAVIANVAIVGVLTKSSPALAMKLTPLTGAIIGSATEAFIETVLNNVAVKDLDYRKIALAAVSGAISSKLGLVGDAIVGGLTDGAFAMVDGQSFDDVLKSIYLGALAGLTLGITLKGVSKIFGTIGNKLTNKLAGTVSEQVADSTTVKVGKNTAVLLETTDDFGTKYVASKTAREALGDDEIAAAIAGKYAKNAYKSLPSPTNKSFKYLDEYGNAVDHKVLNGWIEITDDAPIALKNSLVKTDGKMVKKLKIKNARICFEEMGLPKLDLNNFSLYRTTNFNRADKAIAEIWSENPDIIPTNIRKYFQDNGIDEYSLRKENIARMRELLGLTWHEDINMQTVYLIPKSLHNVNKGGISHIGGISVAKIAKMFNVDNNSAFAYILRYKMTVVQ